MISEQEDLNQVEKTSSSIQEDKAIVLSVVSALSHPHPTTQTLLTTKPLVHLPEAGINPLVDAAAHIFSMMGKLKHIKNYQHLKKLQGELVAEIENFQETIDAYHYEETYLAEYIPITVYALCVTLDDIVTSTPWGRQGWEKYSLVHYFNQEPLSQESFLIILERLVRDPDIYIDVMEFMYICLSLGLKCHHQSSEFGYEQLEQIINSLYKRIRHYRGNFNKILSPFPVRAPRSIKIESIWKKIPFWLMTIVASIFFITLMLSGKYLVNLYHVKTESLKQEVKLSQTEWTHES